MSEEHMNELFGRIIAMQAMLSAVVRTHPNKDMFETSLANFEAISLRVLKEADRVRPDAAASMLQGYNTQMSSLKSAMR